MDGMLFVTASAADFKVINRLLLHLRDWENDSGDRFHLVASKNAYEISSPGSQDDITSPPVPHDQPNAWKGSSLEDVEAFVLDVERAEFEGLSCNTSLFLLLDDKGLDDGTCIIAQRSSNFDSDTDDIIEKDMFDKVRLPWEEIYAMWCNLDIANMDFEEWCDDGQGRTDDGWWEVGEPIGLLPADAKKTREDAIKAMARDGMVDIDSALPSRVGEALE